MKKLITLINILTVFGFAMIGFSVFMGALLMWEGAIGIAAAMALLSVIIMSLILAAAVKSKTADSDFRKWRVIEIIAAALFWVAAIWPGYYAVHFFEVFADKGEFSEMARADVAAINEMFDYYEQTEREAIGATLTGMRNAIDQPQTPAVEEYFNMAAINNGADIDTWIDTQRSLLVGRGGADGFFYSDYRHHIDSITNAWNASIARADLITLSEQCGSITAIVPQVAENLTDNSERAKLPIIEFDNGAYDIAIDNQTVIIQPAELQLPTALSTFSGRNIICYLIYLLIVVIAFLDYIFASRSAKTDIGGGYQTKASGGTVL